MSITNHNEKIDSQIIDQNKIDLHKIDLQKIDLQRHVVDIIEKIHNMNELEIKDSYRIIKIIDLGLINNDYDYNENMYIDNDDLYTIVNNYENYPLYIIKYVCSMYPRRFSKHVVDYILDTNEKRTSIIETILTSYSISLCEIEDIRFNCNFIKTIHELDCLNVNKYEIHDDITLYTTRDRIGVYNSSNTIDKKQSSSLSCHCSSRDHWKKIYDYIMDYLYKYDMSALITNNNLKLCMENLILQTDVVDHRFPNILDKLIEDSDNWRIILSIIKRSKLVSNPYYEIMKKISNRVILSDKTSSNIVNTDYTNKKFRSRELLISLLQRSFKYNSNLAQIIDNIYISDINVASNVDLLHNTDIKHVISITKRAIFQSSYINYYRVPIDDNKNVNIVNECSSLADIMIDHINNEEPILVHCYKGVSRSVSFVILILIKLGYSFDDAINTIRKKRPMANPNPVFYNQLIRYSKNITS